MKKTISIADICKKTQMSAKEVKTFLNLLKYSMKPHSKHVNVIENGRKSCYVVDRNGVGVLKTEYGKFWQYNFTINDQWGKYSVIVKAEIDKKLLIPMFTNKNQLVLRVDSGCETGQVFGDLTCECHDQLYLALKMLSQIGEGMIINIPCQDGRGMGLSFKLGTLWLQDALNLNTVESASLLSEDKVIDIRTYSGAICILKFFGISGACKINLLTNNPKKAEVFSQNGYIVKDYLPIIIPPNKYTEAHLMAKQKYLGHRGLVECSRN